MNGDLVQSETTVGSRHCPGKAKFYGLLAALVIIASAEPLFEQVAKRLPSLRAPHAAAYHVRHVLMHSTPIATPGRRIFLVGSSVVRNNLDEKLLQQMLSRIEPVSVENLGMEAAYCLSVPILCAKLQALKPDLVIWGMSGGEFDQFQKDEECQMPWGSPMAVEFGSSCLYTYMPWLPGRWKALSQDLLLDQWALFRYRLYFRQLLMSLYRARRSGLQAVFGPYSSPSGTPNPKLLAAALKRHEAANRSTDIHGELVTGDTIRACLSAVQQLVSRSGGRLWLAWLPQAVDNAPLNEGQFAAVKRESDALGITLVDLRGKASASGFNDTIHANRDGKRQTTLALAAAWRAALDTPMSGLDVQASDGSLPMSPVP